MSNKPIINKPVSNNLTSNKATNNKATSNKASNNKATNNKTTNNKATNNDQTTIKPTYSSDTVLIIVGGLSLVFVIIYIYNSYKNLYPTPTGTAAHTLCPDYWDAIGNGKCQNSNKLGSCSNVEGADIMDFGGTVFTNNNTGDYSKCKWARGCNVTWGNIDRLC